MATHLLDISVYCQPIKPKPLPHVVSRWSAAGDGQLVTSVIAEAELQFGLNLKGSAKLTAAYESLLRGRLPVLPVDESVGEAFAELKAQQQRRGRPIADLDLLIAATARAGELILATLNARHFAGLVGVVVEDWGQPMQ
jgi:tRNA(fMet)-specific endonuclease VapC